VPAGFGAHAAGLDHGPPAGPEVTTVYVETNNPTPGQNAVLAYQRDSGSGNLDQLGKFDTGGTGQINVPKVIGPDDSSDEVVASSDSRFLFAVNQGSNSVTSFRILRSGALSVVGTFDSGGVEPDSLSVSGEHLYVSNRGDSAVGHPGTAVPNITVFTIADDGSLAAVPNGTVSFPVDTSPSQSLITKDGKLLFADIFAVPGSTAAEGNTLAPFQIQADGTLHAAAGGDVGAPATPPLLLGSAFNPQHNIIYSGLTGAGEIGVFTFDDSGRLSFVDAVADQGKGPCWATVSADGRFLYIGNTGTDSIGVFSLADPLHPVEIQEFQLQGPLAPPGSPAGTLQTNVFQIALSPGGHTLYAIGQSTSPDATFPDGNQLHILRVADDGTVSEPSSPIIFATADVPANAHPQGIAVVAGEQHQRHHHHENDLV
jgi:6-phosphogluconolactonase (cycloisomerase 2 family)